MQPRIQRKRASQPENWDYLILSGTLQCRLQLPAIDQLLRQGVHGSDPLQQRGQIAEKLGHRLPNDIRFASPIQNTLGNDSSQRTPHERTTLVGPQELVGRYRKQKLHEIAVEIRIALFIRRVGRGAVEGKLPSERLKRVHVVLKTWQRPQQLDSAAIANFGRIPSEESRTYPGRWSTVQRKSCKTHRKKGLNRVEKQ